MKNILVTGGFGFLGSHLIEALISNPDNQVHVVDNLCTSPLPLDYLLNELGHPENLTYSILDIETFCRNRYGKRYDEIYHLASVVGSIGVLHHAGRIASSIINNAIALSDLSMKNHARLMIVSSSEVYGGGKEGFCCENMPKIIHAKNSARLEYAIGKLSAEIALINLYEKDGLDVRVLRPFNISGPRQSGKYGFVLPTFIAQAMKNVDITVFGDGQQIRAFTHVKDAVSGILHGMKYGKKGDIYNIGNFDNKCKIIELAEEVKLITNSQSRIVLIDPKTIYGPFYQEANDKFPDSTKAFTEIQWVPKYSRYATVEETFQYMKNVPEKLFPKIYSINNKSFFS